jgi:dTDP-4-amino-4,6-dideoxygalactose transaminase
VGRPNIGDRARLLERMNECLDRRWLTNDGPFVRELEERLADVLGVPHVVAMCNATVALEITIRALGLSGEVLVPSFTFVATAHALPWLGLKPVFAEIDPRTHMLDASLLERQITSETSGIVAVHLWGQSCDVEGLQAVADRHGLPLLLDAAHAFGVSHGGRMVGGFGVAEVFSFHATKFVNAFEGGAVTTRDAMLAERLRLMRNFGFAGYDTVTSVGTNGKMHEISAAMALTSLESMKDFTEANQAHYERYRRQLAGIPGLRLLEFDPEERSNFQYIVIEIDNAVSATSRDDIASGLAGEEVYARRYFYPGCHRMEPYRTLDPDAGLVLPHTELLVERVLVLPTGPNVQDADVDFICAFLRAAVTGGR